MRFQNGTLSIRGLWWRVSGSARAAAGHLRTTRNKLTGIPLRARSPANRETLDFLATTRSRTIAEIGVEWGSTSEGILRWLAGDGTLHLFDYEDRIESVVETLRRSGFSNIVPHANSRRTLDSYNWELMKLLKESSAPLFDYVYLDGAHTWAIDALAFYLVDLLLKRGGYIDFDDYDWTISASPTVNPIVFPAMKRLYTEEQMATAQVKLIVDLLVRRGGKYEEVVPNKIFRKR